MRVLVTGASGLLGHAVVVELIRRGHRVRAGSRHPHDLPAHAAPVRLDLADAASVAAAVRDVDAVCHLAALTRVRDSRNDPAAYWRTNLVGTLCLLDALTEPRGREEPARLVLASTCAVYGDAGPEPVTETHPTAPTSPYGTSKLAADLAAGDVAATGVLGAVSLRAFNLAGACDGVGDRDTTRLLPRALAAAAGTAPPLVVNGDGSATRDYLHVRDMADAVALALEHCLPGSWRPYNLGSGHGTSVAQLLAAVERVTGRPVPRQHREPAPEPASLLADATRAHKELGWTPQRSTMARIVGDAWNALTEYSRDEYSSRE